MEELTEEMPEIETSETVVVDDMPLDAFSSEDKSVYLEESEIEISSENTPQGTLDGHLEAVKAPTEKLEKIVQLPLTRVKNLMKLDPDVNIASQDAVFAIAKAAELFIHMLGKEAYKFTKQNKKKTIQKKDITECIAACESLCFLEGTLKDE